MMNHASDGDVRNLSYFMIPIVLIGTCGAPTVFAIRMAGAVYDNANPREFRQAVASSEMLTKETKQLILRAKGASDNGFENLAGFAGGVVALNQAGVAAWLVNSFAVGYFLLRVAYVVIYVWVGKNRRLAWVRSVCFGASVFTLMGMWITAGLKTMAIN